VAGVTIAVTPSTIIDHQCRALADYSQNVKGATKSWKFGPSLHASMLNAGSGKCTMDRISALAAIDAIQIRMYLAGGRHLAASSDEALTAMWIERYKAWALTPTPGGAVAERDTRAEMLIRGLRLPKEEVAAEQAAFLASNANRRPTMIDLENDPAVAGVVGLIVQELLRQQ